jgi:hypothetical protein
VGAPDPRFCVSFLRSRCRAPSLITLTVAGAAVAASVTAGAVIATAAPPASLRQVALERAAGPPAQTSADFAATVAQLATGTTPERLFQLSRGRLARQQLRWAEARLERRAARRAAARRARARAAWAGATAPAAAHPPGSPQQIARAMLGSFGWPRGQFGCLQSLWNAESGWNPRASNPSSGAYGIPQALPGSKMASAGADWQTSPATQIRWGLRYIRQLYGSPCGAWSHEQADGWY